MSKKLQNYIELTRIKKPIGIMLLFWPCIWGLTIAYNFEDSIYIYIFYAFLFFLGSTLMRSAGCIINDIVDKNFDKKVRRTKSRPIASGKISVIEAIIFSMLLCILAFFVLIQFNLLTIILAIGSMPLAFTYPYMKRFTYWPQLYLGITFNYGLVLGWSSITENVSIIPIIFYLGAIFWTLGYDTIYGYQDLKDDEIIGVKSTSIKFKTNPKKFVGICYFITLSLICVTGLMMNFKYVFFIFMIIPLLHMFFYQIKNLNIKNNLNCLRIFKSNNILGFIIYINIIIGKFA